MILMLQPDQVPAFWDAIRHGVVIAHKPLNEAQFSSNVLERLLIGKAQCWVSFGERSGEKIFNAFGLTTIEQTSLGETYLFLHTLYAYRPIPNDDVEDMIPVLVRYAEKLGINKMVTFTEVKRLVDLYLKWGFTQDTTLMIKEL